MSTLPIRNGNLQTLHNKCPLRTVSTLPIRNGNEKRSAHLIVSVAVSTLPIRNGNESGLPEFPLQDLRGTLPIRNGNFTTIPYVPVSFNVIVKWYLTYKEWKQYSWNIRHHHTTHRGTLPIRNGNNQSSNDFIKLNSGTLPIRNGNYLFPSQSTLPSVLMARPWYLTYKEWKPYNFSPKIVGKGHDELLWVPYL